MVVCKDEMHEDHKDNSHRELIQRVVDGDTQAWTEFVGTFSRFLFSIIWRYAGRDQDRCANLYLYVIEGLHESNDNGDTFHRLRRYLESVDRFNGNGRLTTWLGKVTQNLVSDYFRERLGRRTLPCAIRRLNLACQTAYKLIYWDNLSEQEAFETMKTRMAELDWDRFEKMMEKINQQLKNCNRWSIYCEMIRRTPPLAFQCGVTDSDNGSQLPDPATQIDSKRKRKKAKALAEVLRNLIAELPEESRKLLICRFKHGMTVGKIAEKLQRKDEKRIYSELERMKNQLKRKLRDAGFNWEGVEGGLDAIEGII